MAASKLDQVENISSKFNVSADIALEKKVSQYQLTKEEHTERFNAQKTATNRINEEDKSFKDPEERQSRYRDQYAALAQKYNTPKPENVPQNMGNKPIPKHELMQMAEEAVKLDHKSRIDGFKSDYHKTINNILDRAAQDGRGPQPSKDQDRDQNRNQDNNRNNDKDRD